MKHTFVTTGEVEPILGANGEIKAYYVGRKDSGRMYLTTVIKQYWEEGHTVMIDPWGVPWVKGIKQ